MGQADKEVSIQEKKKFPQSERSINRYLKSLTPSESDKLYMAPFRFDNWDKFANTDNLNEKDKKF